MAKKKIKKVVPFKSWHRKKFNEKTPGFNGIQLRARKIRASSRENNTACDLALEK